MKKEEVEKRKERSEKELLIVSRVEEGLRVYSAADPKKSYIVSGTPDAPICTCPTLSTTRATPNGGANTSWPQ